MKNRNYHIMFLIALVCVVSLAASPSWGATGTVDVRVSDGDDDAEECVAGGSSPGDVERGSSDLEMVSETGTSQHGAACDQIIGLRFRNIAIPQGSEITKAYIQFKHDSGEGTQRAATSLTIRGEDIDDAPEFKDSDASSANDNNISGRTTTTASVPWTPSGWGRGRNYKTSEIKTIVQEIVDRGDGSNPGNWQSGNDMVFIISGSGKRTAVSRNDSSSNAPLLHVEYTSTVIDVSVTSSSDDAEEGTSGEMENLDSTDLEMVAESTDQIVGMRFRNIQVPIGAVITSAYITFEADETDSTDTDLVIQGEDIDDAPTFTSSSQNISNRTRTSQKVDWTDISAWNSTGVSHNSPDISNVIQEIVGRSGWASGNDIVIIISGSGKRVAESYDGSGTEPKIHIEYSVEPVPIITVDPGSLSASHYVGSTAAAATFTITNTGSASMSYTVSDDSSWLSLSSSSGTLANTGDADTITVTYSTASLAVGSHSATITVTDANAPNSPVEIGVNVEVLTLPTSSTCGNVPVYTENLVSPAILVLLDVSGSMGTQMSVSSANDPQTPDLKSIVQHIVGDGNAATTTDRDDWASGNAMVFIITGTGERVADSYNGSSASAPLLHVEYTSGGTSGTYEARVSQGSDDAEEKSSGSVSTTSSDLEMVYDGSNQTVGIRFQNVTIPKDATIDSAYMKFTIDEANSGTTSLTIKGEDLDNPPTFAANTNNISNRTTTTASVPWNASSTPALEAWSGGTTMSRLEIGKDAISDLVTDRGVSWGYGTWTASSSSNYTSSINYTKIHVGTKEHDDTHQDNLQAAISATSTKSGTPFMDSIIAAKNYFQGNKAEYVGSSESGDTYTSVDCQPTFLIDVTDGLGYYGSSVATITTETTNLYAAGTSAVAVGFGIDNATQINAMAKTANALGDADTEDSLYALHEVDANGDGVPFLANNKTELVEALSTITENIKSAVFHGAAPAPTTSADLGDTVLVANFDATDWSGELQAITRDDNDEFTVTEWKATEEFPAGRNVFTPVGGTITDYTDSTLANDNFICKDLGDIINSAPLVVGNPAFFYPFDGYEDWKKDVIDDTNDGTVDTVLVTRETMVYIGANDGALHAFRLTESSSGADDAGSEVWAFFPEFLHTKLNKAATDSAFDMCDGDDYCHQYFVDGSPVAADIYDGSNWKTILVTGLGEGGEAYFALDVTSSKPFDNGSGDQAEYLWEFTDTDLGQTLGDVSIDRILLDDKGTTTDLTDDDHIFGVFFGSGYSETDQDNKVAYFYGVQAHDKANLWLDSGSASINKVAAAYDLFTLYYDAETIDFAAGNTITGFTSGATAVVLGVTAADGTSGSLLLNTVSGTFQDNEKLWVTDNTDLRADVNGTLVTGRLDDALAPVLVADMDFDFKADRIYAGNLYGTMYRVSSIHKDQTPSITKLLEFSPMVTSPNINPIRGKADFAYRDTTGGIWVYFGTGRYETQTDKTDTTQQYFFGLQDDDDTTEMFTYDTSADGLKLGTDIKANLVAESITVNVDDGTGTTTSQEIRIITGGNTGNDSYAVKLLTTSGQGSERVVTKPLVVGGVVFFTTFVPSDDICAGNGDAWVFALDFASGGSPDSPVFDLNDDGVIDENDVGIDPTDDTIKYTPAGVRGGSDDDSSSGMASHPVLHKDSLFVTYTAEGLEEKKVDLEGIQVQLGSWKESLD